MPQNNPGAYMKRKSAVYDPNGVTPFVRKAPKESPAIARVKREGYGSSTLKKAPGVRRAVSYRKK